MRISAITIENFKGIRDPARIELRPVTLLFGANSAGKSTVVQALHYLHEILERRNVDPGRTQLGGEAIDLGGFETLVHRHERGRVLRIKVEFQIDDTDDLPTYRLPYVTSYSDIELFPSPASGWIYVAVAWSELLDRPILERYEVGWDGSEFAVIEASRDLKRIELKSLELFHSLFAEQVDSGEPRSGLLDIVEQICKEEFVEPFFLGNVGLLGQEDALPPWGQPLELQEEAFIPHADSPMKREFVETISQLVVGPAELVRDALRRLRYVGPLRQVPPRNFEAIRSPDEARWAVGLAAWDTLAKFGPALTEEVNRWLSRADRLGTGYRIKVKRYRELDVDSPLSLALRDGRVLDEDDPVLDEFQAAPIRTRVHLRDESNGIEVLPQDVGVGLSQLIPVLVAALAKPVIVAIEQPELHIHPAWQVVLGDLFLSQIDAGATFLIETHSEHLVLRIMRRMRETGADSVPPGAPHATPDEVAVYFVEVTDGQTTIRSMPLDEEGDFIDAWPGGFFEESYREKFAGR